MLFGSQAYLPEGQTLQALLTQNWLFGQQVEPQGLVPDWQPQVVPLMQTRPCGQQIVPAQGVVPVEQVTQVPPWHTWAELQQLFPHAVVPAGYVQVSAGEHTWVGEQQVVPHNGPPPGQLSCAPAGALLIRFHPPPASAPAMRPRTRRRDVGTAKDRDSSSKRSLTWWLLFASRVFRLSVESPLAMRAPALAWRD